MGTSSSSSSNGISNGNGKSSGYGTWIAIALAAASFFWTIANPRDDIKQERQERQQSIREAKTDIEALIRRIDEEILRVKHYSSDKLLTKDEHAEFVRRTDKGVDTIKDEVNRIRSDQVTRSEHQQHWAETTARIDGVRDLNVQLRKETFDAVASLQKEVGGQFTVGDQIKSLTAQIVDLNRRLDMMRGRQVPAQP